MHWLQLRVLAIARSIPFTFSRCHLILTLLVELPGVDPKDITVNVVGDMLRICASRQGEHEMKKRDFLHREFRYGSIECLITLSLRV